MAVQANLSVMILGIATMLAGVAACQQQDGRSPDEAPDGGLNPEATAPRSPARTEGPITDGLELRCALSKAESDLPSEQKLGLLRAEVAEGIVLRSIDMRGPDGRVSFDRDRLDILDTGVYVIEIEASDEQACWVDFEVTSLDRNITVTISLP